MFLDEIEALPAALQSKLLRFLQERQIKPLGQTKYQSVDVRILAATNVDLAVEITQKTFRQDLYYRLSAINIFLPPLRQRMADIPALAQHFVRKYATDTQQKCKIPQETLVQWLSYNWPGNVRELENKVQEWLLFGEPDDGQNDNICAGMPANDIRPIAEVRKEALERCDRCYLENLLDHAAGNLSAAARQAQINRKNLRNLLKKYNIDAENYRL